MLVFPQLFDEVAVAATTTTTDVWSSDVQADRTHTGNCCGPRVPPSLALALRVFLSLYSIQEGFYLRPCIFAFKQYRSRQNHKLLPTSLTNVPRRNFIAIEDMKRTTSISPGAATCSLESPCHFLYAYCKVEYIYNYNLFFHSKAVAWAKPSRSQAVSGGFGLA